jgi:D-glycero-D-manno-heptose 1,7-bisphosphate phosphatase
VTNQSAVARGLVTEDGVARIHAALSEQLERQGARLDDIYYCPHHPDAVVEEFRKVCDCRKPSPGLLLRAASRWDIDLGASYVIGDRIGDLEAGRRAGCHPLLVKTGYGSVTAADLAAAAQTEDNRASLPERTFENLLEAARWIVNRGMKDEG